MRRIVLFIISVTIGCYSLAQDSTFVADSLAVNDSILENDSTDIILLTDAMENAIIHQDSPIYRLLLDKYLGIERGQQEVSGFRVQVYSSNQQQRLLVYLQIKLLPPIPYRILMPTLCIYHIYKINSCLP